MKHCKYCGKELHEFSSFCPYCMNSQIEKQNAVIQKSKLNKWLYFVIAIIFLIAFIAIGVILLNDIGQGENHSTVQMRATEITTTTSLTTTSTETMQTTTITITATSTVKSTTTTSTTENATITTETIRTEFLDYSEYDGIYYPDGLTEDDVKGIYGDEGPGGVELFITYTDQMILDEPDKHLDISIKLFTENNIIEVRHVYIDVLEPQNPIIFDFEDVYGGEGTATLLCENGKIHLTTTADEEAKRQTKIIVDEWLS